MLVHAAVRAAAARAAAVVVAVDAIVGVGHAIGVAVGAHGRSRCSVACARRRHAHINETVAAPLAWLARDAYALAPSGAHASAASHKAVPCARSCCSTHLSHARCGDGRILERTGRRRGVRAIGRVSAQRRG